MYIYMGIVNQGPLIFPWISTSFSLNLFTFFFFEFVIRFKEQNCVKIYHFFFPWIFCGVSFFFPLPALPCRCLWLLARRSFNKVWREREVYQGWELSLYFFGQIWKTLLFFLVLNIFSWRKTSDLYGLLNIFVQTFFFWKNQWCLFSKGRGWLVFFFFGGGG